MSDLNALRSAGIPIRALVDGSGIAIGGSKTLTALRAEGVIPVCQVDASGAALDGSTLVQIRSRGIEHFCPVDGTGLDVTSGLNIAQLAARGIICCCPVDATGTQQNGAATLTQLRQRGVRAIALVDENGTITSLGAYISFSGSLLEGSAQNTVVATPTLVDPHSIYQAGGTWSVVSQTRANWFKITSGATGQVLAGSVASDFETDSAPGLVLQYNDGVLAPLQGNFVVSITDVAAPVLSLPTGTQTGSATATLGVTTTVATGTLYAVVTTSATLPSAAQVKLGLNNLNGAAVFAGNQAISSTGAKTISATGLSASTTYFAYFMHEGLPSEQSNVAASASFATIAVLAPVNTVAPAVTGTETQGSTLSTTNGTWTNSPTSYTYQWMQSVTSGGVPTTTGGGEYIGVPISSATNSTYVLQVGDVGQIIFCEVTAHNAGGSTAKTSNVTGVIASSVTSITTAQPNDQTTWTLTSANLLSTNNTSHTGASVASELAAASPGIIGAFTQIAASPDPLIASTSYKLTGYAKSITGSPWLLVNITDNVTHNAGTFVNLSTQARGTDFTAGFGVVDNVVVTDQGGAGGGGWNKIELTFHVTSNMAATKVLLGWATADNTLGSSAVSHRYQFEGWGA